MTVTRHSAARSRTADRWRLLAAAEVALAVVAVVTDVLVPTLVLLALAAASLAVRRAHPASLGLRPVERPHHLSGLMLLFALGWSLLHLALLEPVLRHLTGEHQDTSDFADLQGNIAMLLLLLVLGWTLAAVGEELAYRGFVLTRLTELFGGSRAAVVLSVLLSSVLFGLAHTEQGVVGVALAGIDGAAYAALRLRYRTLWAPVLAHGFIDTLGFLTFFLVGPIQGWW